MKKIVKMLAFLCLFLSLLLSVGCGKDDDENPPVSVGQPTITPTFVIKSNDTKSVTVSVVISWMTENVDKGTVDGSSINIPSGDTTITMKKGETKMLSFVVENTSGVKNYKYLTVAVPADPIPPTISAYFTYNEQRIDTLPYLDGNVKNVKLIVNFSNGILDLNGVKYENSPVVFDFTVTESKAYNFVVVGLGGEVSFTFTIPVYAPTEQQLLLWNFHWNMIEYYETCEAIGIYRQPVNISECKTDDTWTFYSNDTVNYDLGSNLCVSGPSSYLWPYNFNGNTITLSYPRHIKELTSTKMVWEFLGTWTLIDGTTVPMTIEQVFVHYNP